MNCSNWENQTVVTEFLLLGFSNYQDQRPAFIWLLLVLYLLSIAGNSFIIAAANLDPQLQSPMYFFLSNLSFVDLCLTSVTAPKSLVSLVSQNFCISFKGCITQTYLFLCLIATENFLLVSMAYDRYVAVCKPLHYRLVITKKRCLLLVVTSWLLPCLHALLHVSMALHLCFCGPAVIHSFFCDLPAILVISCSNTSLNHQVVLVESLIVGAVLMCFILATYAWIITSILRLRSAQSRRKAFLTCSSHLTVIVLLYGTAASVYFLPSTTTSEENNIVASLMYTLVTPMLNPFIYSLRNNEIHASFKKAFRRKHFHGL